MANNVVFAILALLIIAIAGCSGRQLPPTNGAAKAPQVPPFSAYGSFVGAERDGSAYTIRLEQELHNCEKNTSRYDIVSTVRPSSLQPDAMVAGKKYLFRFSRQNSSMPWELYIDPSTVDAQDVVERNCRGAHDDDLIIDQLQEYEAMKDDNGEPAYLAPAYEQEAVDPVTNETTRTVISGEKSPALRVVPTVVSSQPTPIRFLIKNRQYSKLRYRINELALADKNAAYTPDPLCHDDCEKERLKNAKVAACTLEYERGWQEIDVYGQVRPAVTAQCSTPTCQAYIEGCDIRGENCRRNEAGCEFVLYGEIEFIDELNFTHIIPKNGLVKQDILIR